MTGHGIPKAGKDPFTGIHDLLAKARRPLVFSMVAAAILYFAATLASGHREVREHLAQIDFLTWILVLSLPLGNYALRFLRWHWYLAHLGHRIVISRNLRVYLAGFALTTTPGKVGETVRSLFLLNDSVGLTDSMAAFVAERFTDLMAVAILAGLASLRFEGYGWFVWLSALALLLGLWFLQRPGLASWEQKHLGRGGRLRQAMVGLVGTLLACRVLLSSRLLLGGLILATMAWAMEGIAFWIVLEALGFSVFLPTAIGIYAIGTLAGALSFIPGGIGAMEGVMSVLLVLLGTPLTGAISAIVVIRIATLWLAVGIGTVAMVSLARNEGKHRKDLDGDYDLEP